MRSDRRTDQAAGLRALAHEAVRVITVASAQAGLGATSVTINLASALARAGQQVLILDEHVSHNNVAHSFDINLTLDLLHAVRGERSMRDIVFPVSDGLNLMSVARAVRSQTTLSMQEIDRLPGCLVEATRDQDIVLVDADSAGYPHLSASLAAEQPPLLVLTPAPDAITESYRLIKRMARQQGRRSFMVVVNRARDERSARAVYRNLAQVAQDHLQVQVEYLGQVPFDERLANATRSCQPVWEAFPGAPSARAFDALARRLDSRATCEMMETGSAGHLQNIVKKTGRLFQAPAMVHRDMAYAM